jgi:hypothetical protein
MLDRQFLLPALQVLQRSVALLLSRHLCAVMKLLAARTSTQNSRHSALVSSMVQGGGKRRADGMGRF